MGMKRCLQGGNRRFYESGQEFAQESKVPIMGARVRTRVEGSKSGGDHIGIEGS